MKNFLTSIFCVLYLSVYSQNSNGFPSFLEGVWQAENQNLYEKWEFVNENSLKGESFKIEAGAKKITETLKIESENNQWVYTATVLNQNNGKGIKFILNKDNDSIYSFENLTHDFPKKIIYQKINDNKLFVQVKGENGKGFSYNMFRTKEPKVIPQWFIKDLEKNVGLWIGDNRKNMSKQDKHTAYGFEYVWGIGKTSIVGTMYGIIDGEKTQDFWTFRHYWDNVKEEAVIVQYGLWGQIGIGNMKPTDNNQMETFQKFSLPDGRTWEVKHVIEMHDDYFISTQYDKDKNDKWIINGGAFKWVKQNKD